MPKRYIAIRDQCMGHKNAKLKDCKTQAAKIFNATRKEGEKPVTGKSEGGARSGVGRLNKARRAARDK